MLIIFNYFIARIYWLCLGICLNAEYAKDNQDKDILFVIHGSIVILNNVSQVFMLHLKKSEYNKLYRRNVKFKFLFCGNYYSVNLNLKR